jgi:anti-anti-sigma factor
MADIGDAALKVQLELTNGAPIVVASGELDLAGAPAFFACLQDADRAGSGPIWIDMAEVTFLDSAGLGVLARLAGSGVALVIRNPSPIARRMLDIGGLDVLPNFRVIDQGGSEQTT